MGVLTALRRAKVIGKSAGAIASALFRLPVYSHFPKNIEKTPIFERTILPILRLYIPAASKSCGHAKLSRFASGKQSVY
ncbi:MAG: hypothetical protein C4324_10685 [Blastocatellia bacterium]